MYTITTEKRNLYSNKFYTRKNISCGTTAALPVKINREIKNIENGYPSNNTITVKIVDFIKGSITMFNIKISKSKDGCKSELEIVDNHYICDDMIESIKLPK